MTLLEDFLDAVRREVRGELRTDTMSRVLYSTDASLYQVLPHGVLFPTHDDDVQAAVTLAARYRVPVLPRTAGTSLAGQAVNEALILDFTRHLDRILEIDPEARQVRVQPGVVLDDLNRALAPHGLQFGPDPASGNRAAMGGIVGNNATGSHSILHGMTADHVEEVEVILADGSRARFGSVDEDGRARRIRQTDHEGAIYREVNAIAREHRDTILQHTPQHWRRSRRVQPGSPGGRSAFSPAPPGPLQSGRAGMRLRGHAGRDDRDHASTRAPAGVYGSGRGARHGPRGHPGVGGHRSGDRTLGRGVHGSDGTPPHP